MNGIIKPPVFRFGTGEYRVSFVDAFHFLLISAGNCCCWTVTPKITFFKCSAACRILRSGYLATGKDVDANFVAKAANLYPLLGAKVKPIVVT
jgi:hypothetical protein